MTGAALRNAALLLAVLFAGVAAAVALDGLDFTLALATIVLALWLCVPRTRP